MKIPKIIDYKFKEQRVEAQQGITSFKKALSTFTNLLNELHTYIKSMHKILNLMKEIFGTNCAYCRRV